MDPFRVHAYAIGIQVADSVIAFLRDRFGDDHVSWGRWLVEHFFAEGRARSITDKLGDLEGAQPDDVVALAARPSG